MTEIKEGFVAYNWVRRKGWGMRNMEPECSSINHRGHREHRDVIP